MDTTSRIRRLPFFALAFALVVGVAGIGPATGPFAPAVAGAQDSTALLDTLQHTGVLLSLIHI